MKQAKPNRNPRTHKKHRVETFWQIYFPLILGSILVIGLAAWTIITATNNCCIDKTANISLVFLILPTMLLALLPLIILGGLAYAVIKLNQSLPTFMVRVQDTIAQVQQGIHTGSNKFTEPVIGLKSKLAAFDALKYKNSKNERV